jgi:hypothetical protein
MSAAPQFAFDSERHEYRENGIVRRSVTQLLNDCGLVCYDHVNPKVLERKAEIGSAAHTAAWFFDEHDLDWRTVAPEVVPYVNAWAKFRMECDFIPRRIETRGIAASVTDTPLIAKESSTISRRS